MPGAFGQCQGLSPRVSLGSLQLWLVAGAQGGITIGPERGELGAEK